MGEVVSVKKVQIAVLAVIAAFALSIFMFGTQAAYATGSEVEMGKIDVAENAKTDGEYVVLDASAHTVALNESKVASGPKAWVPKCVKVSKDSGYDTDASYKVIQVNTDAFKSASSVKVVRLGKNVSSLESGAFANSNVEKVVVMNKDLSADDMAAAIEGSSVAKVKVTDKAQKKAFKEALGDDVKVVVKKDADK